MHGKIPKIFWLSSSTQDVFQMLFVCSIEQNPPSLKVFPHIAWNTNSSINVVKWKLRSEMKLMKQRVLCLEKNPQSY